MLILPPSAASVLLLAEEVMMPVVMFDWAVISIEPAFPVAVSVLRAEIMPFSVVREPVLMVILPPSPVLVVSVIIWPLSSSFSVGLILILPPAPLLEVAAEMSIPSAIVRFWVWMFISPALPVPSVSTVILPLPWMLMFSGAVILMLPPLPLEVVRAEIKPFSVKVILRSGSNSPICSPTPLLPFSPTLL